MSVGCQQFTGASFRELPSAIGSKRQPRWLYPPFRQPAANDQSMKVQVGQSWGTIHTPELPVGSGSGWISAEPTSLPNFFPCLVFSPSPLYRFYLRALIPWTTYSRVCDSDSAFTESNLRQLARLSEKDAVIPKGLHWKQKLVISLTWALVSPLVRRFIKILCCIHILSTLVSILCSILAQMMLALQKKVPRTHHHTLALVDQHVLQF